MSWKKLETLIGDDVELKTFVATQQVSATTNTESINKLELKNTDLLKEVKNFKQGNTLVKELLGVEQINEETVKEALGKKGGDETLKSEIDNWKSKYVDLETQLSTNSNEYNAKLQDMALTNSIRDLGIGAIASTSMSEKIILDSLKQGATLDGDKIVYKNADGTTAFNGSEVVTPQSKLESLKANAEYAPFFKPDVSSGGGKNPATPTPSAVPDNNTLDTSKYKSTDSFMADAMKSIL